jgi:hypothetical protein
MPKTVKELTKERQLILLCSRGVLKEEHISEIKNIMSEKLDWKEILYQGTTHRTLNLMYYHLKNLKLLNKVEQEVLKVMKNECMAYATRNKTYFAEIKNIFDKLYENGIKAAILKGNYLAANIYPSIETRTFNDIDLLIDLKDGDKIVSILLGMEYIQGIYDINSGEIIPTTRKENLHHQMASHELQECLKRTDNPFVTLFVVDLNFDVLWKGNCPYKIQTEELLSRAIEVDIDGAKTCVLDYEDFLIQLSCHLYKEAALLNWITDLRDSKIYKFADILMFVEKHSNHIDWDKLIMFCNKIGCEKILFFAFYYVNLMYGQVIPERVMNALEPDDIGYLDEYGVENETPSKWQFDFFTRLFETDRVLEISETALEKKKSFWDTKNKFKQQ